jgi:hypothetical protein
MTTTAQLSGKAGIIWQDECGWSDASRHMDVWNINNAMDHYYTECDNVYVWPIKISCDE